MDDKISIFIGADTSEWLPMQVLMFSIKRHCPGTVEFFEVNNALVPQVMDPCYLPFTNFSFGRFIIPKLKKYTVKAIYLDSDMGAVLF